MSTSLEKIKNDKVLPVGGYPFVEGWTSTAYYQDQRYQILED